jgi:hypothetical protein
MKTTKTAEVCEQCVQCETYTPVSMLEWGICDACVTDEMADMRRNRPAECVWYTRDKTGRWKASRERTKNAVLVRKAAMYAILDRCSRDTKRAGSTGPTSR